MARKEPKSFVALLGRVLPLQVTGQDAPAEVTYLTREEVIERLRERGIPVEHTYLPPTPQ